jgi:ATP-dependent helicase/nuclease subunit A
MNKQFIADQEHRKCALNPHRSFIVQAPAGSGKTELLVRRFLVLLDAVENPEEIVAVTFTRKAAAEMRKRVFEGLARSGKSRWPLEDMGQRLRIHTIDALCTSLTRQMPILARFGAQPRIAQHAQEHYREAASRTLALLESGNPSADDIGRLLVHLDGNAGAVGELIACMLARRDQWLRKTGAARSRGELEAALVAERARLMEEARALYPAEPPADADAWRELAQSLLTRADRAWRKRPPVPPQLAGNEPLREALCSLLDMPPARYSEAQWETLGAIVALLPRAAAELKLVFGEHGEVDFTEVAQGAVRALGSPDDPTDLLLSLDARLRHILVDEFQDTSISQWELLERLTAGWQDGEGRTLFLVGDPMQSIYRFREAEVGIFLHARHHGIGGIKLEPLTLQTNFRSQAGIVDWVNQAFQRILPAEEDESTGAVAYTPSVPHHSQLPGNAVSWHGFFDSDRDAARAAEARRVIEIIAARRQESTPARIAILVRNRGCLERIVPALEEAGLRFRAIEIEHLGEKQVVQDLLALTRALAHPADRIAWLALLRAPWCGLGLPDLARLGEGTAAFTLWELLHDEARLGGISEDGRACLIRLRDVLGPALANRLRGGLRERVEGAWLALGGPACVESATDLADAEIFLDHLAASEQAGDIPDLAALEESLEKLYALPDLSAGDDAIEIMTIHKAKGLEFDTVILPGLDRAPGRSESPLLIWKERPDGTLLLAPIKQAGEKKEPIYDYVCGLDRVAEDNEAGRLLYVAATRAQSRLHLLACAGSAGEGEDAIAKPPIRRSLLAKAWPVAEAALMPCLTNGAALAQPLTIGDPAVREQQPVRLARSWILPAAPVAVNGSARDPVRDLETEIEFSWAGEIARQIGSVVHRWLQRIADDELRSWDAARVAALKNAYRRELVARGLAEGALETATARVVAALTNAVTDERGRWLLGPRKEARNEHRITAIIDGERVNLVIDRTFLDDENRRWIVDYKTSGHEGADVEAFFDREQERYRAQLGRYAAAGKDGRAMLGLYFPLLGGWRQWEGHPSPITHHSLPREEGCRTK